MGLPHHRSAIRVTLEHLSLTHIFHSGAFPFLTHFPELTLDYWAKKFGGLYSIWLGSQLFMIISDPVVAKDLLITNGAIFSSRKEYFIKWGTIFKGRGVTTTPYGEKW